MKYICLIYQNEKAMSELTGEDWNALVRNCMLYTRDIADAGYYVMGDALESVHTATCVRVRSGKVSVTDGPFAETKEQLAGYCLLDARDLNEAIQVASQMPPLRYGCIEIRPIREINGDSPRFFE